MTRFRELYVRYVPQGAYGHIKDPSLLESPTMEELMAARDKAQKERRHTSLKRPRVFSKQEPIVLPADLFTKKIQVYGGTGLKPVPKTVDFGAYAHPPAPAQEGEDISPRSKSNTIQCANSIFDALRTHTCSHTHKHTHTHTHTYIYIHTEKHKFRFSSGEIATTFLDRSTCKAAIQLDCHEAAMKKNQKKLKGFIVNYVDPATHDGVKYPLPEQPLSYAELMELQSNAKRDGRHQAPLQSRIFTNTIPIVLPEDLFTKKIQVYGGVGLKPVPDTIDFGAYSKCAKIKR